MGGRLTFHGLIRKRQQQCQASILQLRQKRLHPHYSTLVKHKKLSQHTNIVSLYSKNMSIIPFPSLVNQQMFKKLKFY